MAAPALTRGIYKELQKVADEVNQQAALHAKQASGGGSTEDVNRSRNGAAVRPLQRARLLMRSIEAGQCENVKTLLSAGRVDPNGVLERPKGCRYSGHLASDAFVCVSPLWLAAALGEHMIVSALVEAGALILSCIVMRGRLVTVSPWQIAMGNHRVLQALHADGRNPIPFMEAIRVALFGSEEALEVCLRPGALRWNDRSINADELLSEFIRREKSRQFLSVPCPTDEDLLCRAVLVQYFLLRICTLDKPSASRDLLPTLLTMGASANGWSHRHFSFLYRAVEKVCKVGTEESKKGYPIRFMSIPQPMYDLDKNFLTGAASFICPRCLEKCVLQRAGKAEAAGSALLIGSAWSAPCLLPVVMRYCTAKGDADDELVQYLLTCSDVPWLETLQEIPWADGLLHDGHTCDHANLSEEQRRVSLSMCTFAGSGAESLKSLCRTAVLSRMPADDQLGAMGKLPLHPFLKAYLLC